MFEPAAGAFEGDDFGAAWSSLAGTPQADWAKHVALNGCTAALAAVLSAPATKFLIVGVYGTHPWAYKGYVRARRLLRTYKTQQKHLNRILAKNARQRKAIQTLVTSLEEKWAGLPAHDLQTFWSKEVTGRHLEVGRTLVADIEMDRAEIPQQLADAKKNQQKMERKVSTATTKRPSKPAGNWKPDTGSKGSPVCTSPAGTTGQRKPPPARDDREMRRASLARKVRASASASATEAEFVRRARDTGMLVRPRYAKNTAEDIVGYSVAQRPARGERPIWFGGGTLASALKPNIITGSSSRPNMVTLFRPITAATASITFSLTIA